MHTAVLLLCVCTQSVLPLLAMQFTLLFSLTLQLKVSLINSNPISGPSYMLYCVYSLWEDVSACGAEEVIATAGVYTRGHPLESVQ